MSVPTLVRYKCPKCGQGVGAIKGSGAWCQGQGIKRHDRRVMKPVKKETK